MKTIFNAALTGSDGKIEGIVKQVDSPDFGKTYKFTSIDNTLHLTIGKDDEGKWMRIAGTEPYFSGWVDELTEQIEKNNG